MPDATVGPIGGDTAADDDIQGTGPTVAPTPQLLGEVEGPLERKELEPLHAWWRAANYLAVGQIYLLDNPLLREPLRPEHVKPRLLGHWGTTPGLNLVWAHANRLVRRHDLDAVFVAGPGHGGPGPNAAAWLEGPTASCTATFPRTSGGYSGSSASSPSPAGSPATAHRRPPGHSTRAANSATRSSTRSARCWTAPTWSPSASSATGRPKPARWPPAGTSASC